MYCNAFGLLHIFWVVLSFILPNESTFFLSSLFMIPVYTFEFSMVYLGQSETIKEKTWYQNAGGPGFTLDLRLPVFELLLYYIIMLNFWTMISATYQSVKWNQNQTLKDYYFGKINDPTKSKLWKFSFYFFKYIQLFVLLALFLAGETQIDRLPNLVYICAFVIYTAFDKFYRKTSLFLIMFMCFLIFGQYFFGLKYHMFIEKKYLMYNMKWYGFVQCDKYTIGNLEKYTWEQLEQMCIKTDPYFPHWTDNPEFPNRDAYFRQLPFYKDIVILIAFTALH
jgi:hypothetical protein